MAYADGDACADGVGRLYIPLDGEELLGRGMVNDLNGVDVHIQHTKTVAILNGKKERKQRDRK